MGTWHHFGWRRCHSEGVARIKEGGRGFLGTSRATGWGQVVSLGGLRVTPGNMRIPSVSNQTKSGLVDKGTDRLGLQACPGLLCTGRWPRSAWIHTQALLKDGGEVEWRVCFIKVRQSYHVLGSLLRALDAAQFLSLSTTNISGRIILWGAVLYTVGC